MTTFLCALLEGEKLDFLGDDRAGVLTLTGVFLFRTDVRGDSSLLSVILGITRGDLMGVVLSPGD